jgi:hypothetical protein
MEQCLDPSYLRAGPIERAAAIGIMSVGVGTAILLGAWGVSLIWRYTPPEIAVRIANPEVRVAQGTPLMVTQERPFTVAQPEPFKIDSGGLSKSPGGNVISREVTVFSNVHHGPGLVVTGWSYRDGSGREPVRQYCYYTAPKPNGSSTKVDIASDTVRTQNIEPALVPELEGALAKCQWWRG